STWIVNSLVFFAVLCSVMLAVVISARFPLRPSLPLYGLLFAALLLAYLLPPDALLMIQAPALRYALASLIAFLPVFLANLVVAPAVASAPARGWRRRKSSAISAKVTKRTPGWPSMYPMMRSCISSTWGRPLASGWMVIGKMA